MSSFAIGEAEHLRLARLSVDLRLGDGEVHQLALSHENSIDEVVENFVYAHDIPGAAVPLAQFLSDTLGFIDHHGLEDFSCSADLLDDILNDPRYARRPKKRRKGRGRLSRDGFVESQIETG